MSEYALMCPKKQDSENAWGSKYAKVLNMLEHALIEF